MKKLENEVSIIIHNLYVRVIICPVSQPKPVRPITFISSPSPLLEMAWTKHEMRVRLWLGLGLEPNRWFMRGSPSSRQTDDKKKKKI